VVFLISR